MTDENDDIDYSEEELDDSVVAEEHQGDTIKKLKERLKTAEDKAKEYLDNWQRAQADFVNLRKRDEEAKTEFMKFANTALILELIPVLDSCHQAAMGGHKDVEVVYNQLLNILKKQGLEELDSVGEIFDPKYHEAVGVEKVEKEEEDHTIKQVLQKGYVLNGRVIRPAKVKIGEFDKA